MEEQRWDGGGFHWIGLAGDRLIVDGDGEIMLWIILRE